ncbi:hypothetical protein ACLI4U_13190 [Natrialbaceae archaeon A-CW2]
MDNGPRRQRANTWAWVYLMLFGDGDEGTDRETESADQVGGSTQEPSDGPETR